MTNQALAGGDTAAMSSDEEAAARSLIMSTIYRYASLARENADHSQTAKLFEPGGTITFPDGRELLPSQLTEVTSFEPPTLLRHHLTTIDIQFVSAEVAHAQSYVIAGTHLKMPDHWGSWEDVLRKQNDGRWLFEKKVVRVDGVDPDGWLAKVLPAPSGDSS